ncbi:MAG: HTH domain-containing protein [Firmicutes bacterium]|nr:HTH domain-containing protein [Bacillota bacterium]
MSRNISLAGKSTDSQARLWDILRQCKSRKKAVTSRQLSRLTGINEREVRSLIADLRRDGYPIASAVNAPYGYFIPVDRAEARECQGHLYSRIQEIGITARALDRAFGEHLPGRQMILDLFEREESKDEGLKGAS